MPLPINVSPTAMQMLAVIVDRNPADMATLLECVRQPEDVIAWVNELQTLLDHELVVRQPSDSEFVYRATSLGVDFLYGFMHPIAIEENGRSFT